MGRAGLALAALVLAAGSAQAASAGTFEDRVLAKINQVRRDPRAYARELRREERSKHYSYGYRFTRAGYEQDSDATEEAIAYLMRTRPLAPLRRDFHVAAAAAEHVRGQEWSGRVGHGAPGSLGRRLHGHGVWAGVSGESISYGQRSPSQVVEQLVVDRGVPDRGHRQDIFGRAYQLAGVACGPHAEWGSMCVIDFAGEVVRR
jgi:uncharacterized protein YkwD